MGIDANTGLVIDEKEAINYTHAFQEKLPEDTKAFFVGEHKLKLILSQEGCMGIRIYNGFNKEANTMNRVLVGVGAGGEDMLRGIILQDLTPCPPICSSDTTLIKE